MYHTGLDPFTGEEVFTAKHLLHRKFHGTLLRMLKSGDDLLVRGWLIKADRVVLIGRVAPR